MRCTALHKTGLFWGREGPPGADRTRPKRPANFLQINNFNGGGGIASISSCGPGGNRFHPVAQLDLVQPMVAAQEDDTMPRPSTITGNVLIRAPAGRPTNGTSSTLLRPGVLTGSARAAPPAARPAALRRGDLDIGGVARGQRDLVLAGRTGRHVLVGAGATHHPDVGLDPVPAQSAAIEDAFVGTGLQLVGAVSPSSSRSKE